MIKMATEKEEPDPRLVEWCRKLAPLAGTALGEMVACRQVEMRGTVERKPRKAATG